MSAGGEGARPLVERVAVIGTGLVGASIGLAVRRAGLCRRVAGYDVDGGELATAVERGAVTDPARSAAEAAADADVVWLAVPVSAVESVAAEVGPAMRAGAILSDSASVKSRVVEALQVGAPPQVHVIGGHPMAGSAETGAAHASAELFVGATWLLTPTTHTDPEAYRRLHGMVAALGARVIAVAPERHDLLVAVVSHLPQLAATTLMNLAADRARDEHAGLLLLAAGGFRDATRVAASNPDLWSEICAENREAIVAVLDEYRDRLETLRASLAKADDEQLRDELAAARAARRDLPRKTVPEGALVELLLAIPDRPGVLAEVTTTVGRAGVNIEDLAIEHAPEGGQGRLRLVLAGDEAAAAARRALEAQGFDVWVERP
jgi:prephenate dehydrogenase